MFYLLFCALLPYLQLFYLWIFFLLWGEYQAFIQKLLMTKCISFKSYTFLSGRVSKTLSYIIRCKSSMCAHALAVPTESTHYRTVPGTVVVYALHCRTLFLLFKNQAYIYKYAGSDGGANVLGTVLGHGRNPQASELLCVLSIPGDSEGIAD